MASTRGRAHSGPSVSAGFSGLGDAALTCFVSLVQQAARTSTRILLVIDEAHVLTSAALGEVVRACAARAAGALNVLTVLLVGKTSWSGRWPQPELAALAARTARPGRLTALGDRDVASYIRHRLLSVGAPTNAFTAGAVTAIASLSRGTTTRENPTPARSSTGADQPLTPGRRQTLNEATVLR
jgi:type II secretory pathway predicted ATPase ExeA